MICVLPEPKTLHLARVKARRLKPSERSMEPNPLLLLVQVCHKSVVVWITRNRPALALQVSEKLRIQSTNAA